VLLRSRDGQLYHGQTATASCSTHNGSKRNATHWNRKNFHQANAQISYTNYSFSTHNEVPGVRKRQEERERSVDYGAFDSQTPG